jgi:DNA-binding transcriptional regulator YhcF (GntR family)
MANQLGPKASRILEYLQGRIQNGSLPPGERLPSHAELAKEFGAALMTIRQALARLEADGFISSQQGRGTFVLHRAGRSVLILEDDPDNGEVLAAFVRAAGGWPELVTNVHAALARLTDEVAGRSIVLVLSDVRVPTATDGIAFIRAVRRRWPDLPIAAVTGYPDDLAGLLGTAESPILVLSKPFRSSQVREMLGLVLSVPQAARAS